MGNTYLALDIGKKTIGIAIGYEENGLALPVGVIKRMKFSHDLAELRKLIAEYGVTDLVIGLPLNQDGSYGPSAQSVGDTAEAIRQNLPDTVSLHYQDERHTTEEARRRMQPQSRRAQKDKGLDAHAAALILGDFLARRDQQQDGG